MWVLFVSFVLQTKNTPSVALVTSLRTKETHHCGLSASFVFCFFPCHVILSLLQLRVVSTVLVRWCYQESHAAV